MDAPAERAKTPWYAPTEAGVLRISIIATAVVAALGIVFGLLSGSYAIVFDGVYSLADGATSVVALLVANLIANYNASDASNRRLVEKFTTVQQGSAWYAWNRAMMIRRLRLPKPQVRHGQRPA